MEIWKPLAEWDINDLQQIIGVQESDRWEFKRDPYSGNDEDTREMLRDIAAMANASGGHLLIGVDTNADERATAVMGVPSAANEEMRIVSSVRSNIEEQIIGFATRMIEITPDRHVIAIQIPRSTRTPHMVTFKGLYQCWKRHGRQKSRMTIEEIREACIRVENLRRSLEDFVEERRSALLQNLPPDPAITLTATPLIVKDEVIDTADIGMRALLSNPPNQRRDGFNIAQDESPKPTLYGLRVTAGPNHVELFRNGHIEARTGVRLWGKADAYLNPWAVAELPLSFAQLGRAVFEKVSLREPIVFTATLANISEKKLWAGRGEGSWKESRLLRLPAFQMPYPIRPGIIARHIANRFWNAFGLEDCPLFNAEGVFNVQAIPH